MKTTTLLENDFQKVLFHDDLGICEQRFKPASEMLFGDNYIREVSLFGDTILKARKEENPFYKLIINTLAGGPTMEPKVQDFMHNDLYPKLVKAGITTKAYCLGEEIIAKLSVELTADNDPKKQFNYQFFSSLEDGIAWLKTQ